MHRIEQVGTEAQRWAFAEGQKAAQAQLAALRAENEALREHLADTLAALEILRATSSTDPLAAIECRRLCRLLRGVLGLPDSWQPNAEGASPACAGGGGVP